MRLLDAIADGLRYQRRYSDYTLRASDKTGLFYTFHETPTSEYEILGLSHAHLHTIYFFNAFLLSVKSYQEYCFFRIIVT